MTPEKRAREIVKRHDGDFYLAGTAGEDEIADAIRVAVRVAVAEERYACAKVAVEFVDGESNDGDDIAVKILARGKL